MNDENNATKIFRNAFIVDIVRKGLNTLKLLRELKFKLLLPLEVQSGIYTP